MSLPSDRPMRDVPPQTRRSFHVRMDGRADGEDARGPSPLELLFDLVFVVAIASLVLQLAADLIEGRVDHFVAFAFVFFAIWWAWMSFTWFASAYDTDDALYRILCVVQMAGVLIIAAGVPGAFEHGDYSIGTFGYLVMRVGLVALWIRAAIEHPERRATNVRYAVGITVVQLGWLARLQLPDQWLVAAILVLVIADMAVPLWAERAGATPWHPGHIAERYGLFTIILLGEGVLAATNAVQKALAAGLTPSLVVLGVGGLLLLVGLWWTYFLEPAAEGLRAHPRRSFFWGYGHFPLFAAFAAVGAGLEVAVESITHHIDLSHTAVGFVVATPVAIVLVLLWVLFLPFTRSAEIPSWLLLPAAGIVLCSPFAAEVIGIPGVVCVIAGAVGAVIVGTMMVRRPEPLEN